MTKTTPEQEMSEMVPSSFSAAVVARREAEELRLARLFAFVPDADLREQAKVSSSAAAELARRAR